LSGDRQSTLVALWTPAGRSALATLIVDGPDAVRIARDLFHPARRIPRFGEEIAHYYGHFGRDVPDDVVLAVVRPGRTVEIHCHGGPAVVESLIEQIRSAGASPASWRESARRQGWSQNRIEAAEALARAGAPKAAAILLDQYQGALDRAFKTIEETRDRRLAEGLLQWRRVGRRLVDGWRVALLGRPNVGKSSLFNVVVGYERVIVSPTAGTTRDAIEVEAVFDGWPVRLCDGAGLRETRDLVEQAGVERIRTWAQSADVRVLLRDASEPPCLEDDALIRELSPHLVIAAKSDLPSPWKSEDFGRVDLTTSATTGEGVAELIDRIVREFAPKAIQVGEAVPFTDRQFEWLERRADPQFDWAGGPGD
jgi:tRNA modification GTPase